MLTVAGGPVVGLLAPDGTGALLALLVTTAVLACPGRRDRVTTRRSRRSLLRRVVPEPEPASVAVRGPLTAADVASAMVLLAVALRSGCGVVEAVEAVARVSEGRVHSDLVRVAAAYRWGVDAGRAWTLADPGWSGVARALGVAERAGVPPSALLVDGAGDLRRDELAALDVAGARVGVRMVLPLGLAFLPAFCLTSVVPLVVALAGQVLGG